MWKGKRSEKDKCNVLGVKCQQQSAVANLFIETDTNENVCNKNILSQAATKVKADITLELAVEGSSQSHERKSLDRGSSWHYPATRPGLPANSCSCTQPAASDTDTLPSTQEMDWRGIGNSNGDIFKLQEIVPVWTEDVTEDDDGGLLSGGREERSDVQHKK